MTPLTRVTLALAMTSLSVGCGRALVDVQDHLDPAQHAEDPAVADPDGRVSREAYDATEATVRQTLHRLAALQVVTVGAMVVDAPAGAGNCYGPCEDDPTDQAFMVAHAAQAARLTALTAEAERLLDAAPEGVWSEVPAAISDLQALRIVEVVGIFDASDGNCYVGQCPGDAVRAGVVSALASGE